MTDKSGAPSASTTNAVETLHFLAGGGETGELARGYDWTSSSLGDPATWPQALRMAVSLVLASRQPMLVAWGSELINIYNDAFIPICGAKHPQGWGQPYAALWHEIWDEIEPMVVAVSRGEAQWFEDMPFALAGREQYLQSWFNFSYTPLRDEAGSVAGFLCVATETTDKMVAERKRQAQTEHQRQLFEQAPGFIAVLRGPGHVFEFANESYARLIGGRDVIGKTVRDALPELEGQPFYDLLDQVYRTGERFVASHVPITLQPFPNAPTVDRFLDFIYEPMLDDGGAVNGIFIEGYDTTDAHLSRIEVDASERRQALLMELSERSRDIEDIADLSFVAGDILGRAMNVSRAGYGTIDPVAETITVVRDWHAPGIESLAGTLRFRDFGSYIDDIKRGETVVFEDAYKDPRTRDGADGLKAISAQAAVNMPVMEQGGVVALLYLNHAVAREWTRDELDFLREVADRTRTAIERRRAERELRELATGLEQLVEERTAERDRVWTKSRDLLVILDAEGTFLRANPAWAAVLGYESQELVGHSYLDFVWPEDALITEGALEEASSTADLTSFENRYRHKDGSARWISWHTSLEDGLVYAYGRHITAEKEQAQVLRQVEEQLRQAQKMEAVGQLTGGLAHDFNNLLAGISGSLDLLSIRLAQGRTADLDRYITAAQGASKRAAALTHRLLAFSRRQTLDPKPINVNRLITGMEDLVRRTVGPSINVEVVGAAGLWNTFVDPHQLENALLNLCINARDAMPDGGRLTIETGNRWIDQHAGRARDLTPGQYLSLCVSDTGTGMSPEVVARAFDPFFTTKPLGMGTGLGLSMIYGFAKQSGGHVRIYSEQGEGAMVCIYLPRHHGDEINDDEALSEASSANTHHGETVLVVDDEPTVRMLVTELLGDWGYRSLEAEDGAAALKIMESEPHIDLLVTDVGLPGGMNGRQVADAARALQPNLKILFITGYAENAAIGNGHLEPGMEVLTKPFAVDDLAARIKTLIGAS